jgi:hypothetical protein
MGSEEYGGELFGDYETPEAAAAAAADILLRGFKSGDVTQRAFLIVAAPNKRSAEK